MASKKSVTQAATKEPTTEPLESSAKASPDRRTTRKTASRAPHGGNAPGPIGTISRTEKYQQPIEGAVAQATGRPLSNIQRSLEKPKGSSRALTTTHSKSQQSIGPAQEIGDVSPATRAGLNEMARDGTPIAPDELTKQIEARATTETAVVGLTETGDRPPPATADEDDNSEKAREELRLFRDDVQGRLAEVKRVTAERVALSKNQRREMSQKTLALEEHTSAMSKELSDLKGEVSWCRTYCSELSREGRVQALERRFRELDQ